jgi:uncharacterized protein (TIGR04255 family)
MPPPRRVFYVDPTGNFLLQVQPTRFLSNWRKERPADAYPRYVTAFQRFSSGWTGFVDFATEASFGVPRTNQYELTYINHIEELGERFPAGIGQYLPLLTWGGAQSTGFLPAPRNALLRLQFALPDGSGRLHVTVNHGLRQPDGKGILVVDLTARGPAKPDWSDMATWFDVAHEWIVHGFTDLTSRTAHQRWERSR